MTKRHEGKIFVVTGAARSMGQAVAARLSSEGAKILGLDLLDMAETQSLVAANGGKMLAVITDLTSPDAVKAAHQQCARELGGVDGIVNVAGILPAKPWEEMDYGFWTHVQKVNVDSMFLTCKEFVADLRSKKAGSIVNFSSGVFWGAVPNCIAYRTSKAAIIGLTRGLAVDLGGDNIRANTVTPSFVMTEGTRPDYGGHQDAITAAQLLKRPAASEDINGLVSFLLSDDAAFITGQMMHADGGLVMN